MNPFRVNRVLIVFQTLSLETLDVQDGSGSCAELCSWCRQEVPFCFLPSKMFPRARFSEEPSQAGFPEFNSPRCSSLGLSGLAPWSKSPSPSKVKQREAKQRQAKHKTKQSKEAKQSKQKQSKEKHRKAKNILFLLFGVHNSLNSSSW
jgi:hypothetical protein